MEDKHIKCKEGEHSYFPISYESYQLGPKAIQKATSLTCSKCLDVKYITDIPMPTTENPPVVPPATSPQIEVQSPPKEENSQSVVPPVQQNESKHN